jgi:hypothetical protein
MPHCRLALTIRCLHSVAAAMTVAGRYRAFHSGFTEERQCAAAMSGGRSC